MSLSLCRNVKISQPAHQRALSFVPHGKLRQISDQRPVWTIALPNYMHEAPQSVIAWAQLGRNGAGCVTGLYSLQSVKPDRAGRVRDPRPSSKACAPQVIRFR